jgi:malate dehydrogenase (oxaloacetate-decarboxylating)(NADP+)
VLIGDTLVNEWPDDRDLALIAERGAHVARELGLEPRVAFVSFSTFGYPVSERAVKMHVRRWCWTKKVLISSMMAR